MIIENKTKRVPLKKRERDVDLECTIFLYVYISPRRKKNNSQICTRRCSKCDSLV